ncbi:hypothetical protein QPK31_25690, partial [Massilia sp. YIM B02769]|uniref:hypothetical protein n=1 Tax=Massilia sp. YIM B02769 TaxID=3050129 RepID=UPI0025B6450D
LIVKELIRYCLLRFDKSFCLSAAEKRDYAVFRLRRQLLFSSSLSHLLVCTSVASGNRTIAKRHPRRKVFVSTS